MGTIAQKLTYLEDTKTRIGNAITAKGGSVTGKTFRQYATEISNLPSGGGGTPIAESVDVSNYTGGTSFNLLAQITDVNWPSGITEIGQYGLSRCENLTTITVPNTVTNVQDDAFYKDTNLTSVTFSGNLSAIGTYCFMSCTNLVSVAFNGGVSIINGDYLFYSCTSIQNVNFGQVNSIIFSNTSNRMFENVNLDYNHWLNITINSVTPPSITKGSSDFLVYMTSSPYLNIYVPAASVDTYKAASGWNSYASRIQAIPSE